MIVNIRIEIDDDTRNRIANIIDGKRTKRLAKRIECVRIAEQHFGGLAHSEHKRPENLPQKPAPGSMYTADHEDVPLMAQPNNPGYVYGWNKVKRGVA